MTETPFKERENLIILGSGPAGLTAAIYAARANLEPLVLEGYEAGGQLMLTTEVENYPGFPNGILGPEMMRLFREQAIRFGTRCLQIDATKVDFSKHPFQIWAEDKLFKTSAVIIATGASANLLGLPSESRLLGHGVSTCATCDGAFFKGDEITVIGGGDSAVEEAIFLTRFASKVTLIHRRDQLRASKIVQERAFKNPKIHFQWNSVPTEFLGEKTLEGVRIKNVQTGKEEALPCLGAFVAIGHTPNTKIFAPYLELDSKGYIVIRNQTKTNIDGIFVAGDVQDARYRQAVTAAGSGCMAALDAEKYLESLPHL
ncbi:MAG: thioredoxin-disulfide reductase [Deltaproteobacteria bacterium]|nr:thioredoxin-disulfide reductase [Deltaproteobacteria bacterium]